MLNHVFRLYPALVLFLAMQILMTAKSACSAEENNSPPNIIVIFADDLGYGDLSCYGATGWQTPNLDQLALNGVRFTDFYVAQPVCSASRTALLTGCYPNRLGIHGALGPQARHGIHQDETTIAEVLKQKNYATAAIGKWHLGHHPTFLPTRHGFDQYFGLPYSNDMWPYHPELKPGTFPALPLIQNESIFDSDVTADDQSKLTQQYTDRAVEFIHANRERPFFLYLAHSMPHVPLFAGTEFRHKSASGLLGDVLQEIDASVGTVVKTIQEAGLAEKTLIIFTSDNGPWLSYGNHAGTAGKLREGKGTVWEGGIRVPFIASWPGKITAETTCRQPAMTIDLLPTFAKLTGAGMPHLKIDGREMTSLLFDPTTAKSPQQVYFFYYQVGELQALRSGKWKLILPHTYRTMQGQAPGKDGTPGKYRMVKCQTELYDLESDPGETRDVAAENSVILRSLLDYAEQARSDLGDSLTKRNGSGNRKAGLLPTF